jgi:hypothetical protein
MSPLDSFWNGVLSLATPIVTPDWGKLVALIPLLLLLLVLLFLALIARAWWRLLRSQPTRGPKVRRRSLRPLVIGHFAVIGIGIVTVILAFAGGARDPNWDAANSPVGLVVNFPLLILGLAVAIGAGGNAGRLWERHGRDDIEPDVLDHVAAAVHRHPARAKRAVVFFAGVLIAATGLLLGAVPGWTTGQAAAASATGAWPQGLAPEPLEVAAFPVLLLGLVLAIAAGGSAIAAVWPDDRDLEAAPADDSSALAVAEH